MPGDSIDAVPFLCLPKVKSADSGFQGTWKLFNHHGELFGIKNFPYFEKIPDKNL